MGKTFIDEMMEEVEKNRQNGVYARNLQYRNEHPINIEDIKLSDDAKKFLYDDTLTEKEEADLFAKLYAKGEISHFTCAGTNPEPWARYMGDKKNEN